MILTYSFDLQALYLQPITLTHSVCNLHYDIQVDSVRLSCHEKWHRWHFFPLVLAFRCLSLKEFSQYLALHYYCAMLPFKLVPNIQLLQGTLRVCTPILTSSKCSHLISFPGDMPTRTKSSTPLEFSLWVSETFQANCLQRLPAAAANNGLPLQIITFSTWLHPPAIIPRSP